MSRLQRIRQITRFLTNKYVSSVGCQFSITQYPNMSKMDKDRIVWVDLEMTGLDIDTCHIIEMACLITDADLNVVAEAPNLVIHQSDKILNEMGEWCIKHHGESGLTKAVRESDLSLSKSEDIMVDFLEKNVPPSVCPLAGNSVHEDRRFLKKYMPRFLDHLHYRILDVSTLKELCRRWYPKEYKDTPRKALNHRALDDIKESIRELQYYRKSIFK